MIFYLTLLKAHSIGGRHGTRSISQDGRGSVYDEQPVDL